MSGQEGFLILLYLVLAKKPASIIDAGFFEEAVNLLYN
jgi:hypothetical protein